jgi:hypothetical protein
VVSVVSPVFLQAAFAGLVLGFAIGAAFKVFGS